MTQQELVARLVSVYVWIPASSSTARGKMAELIRHLGGQVPHSPTWSESPAENSN
jgi:hypothetical protein